MSDHDPMQHRPDTIDDNDSDGAKQKAEEDLFKEEYSFKKAFKVKSILEKNKHRKQNFSISNNSVKYLSKEVDCKKDLCNMCCNEEGIDAKDFVVDKCKSKCNTVFSLNPS